MNSDLAHNEIYLEHFQPKVYMETYFLKESGLFFQSAFLNFMLKNLHKTFSSGAVKGNTLIDIGCGPTIYQIMSACECFEEIIVTDLCEQNLQEYKRWLQNEPDTFDWSPVGNIVCELEGDRDAWPEKEKKIRAKVKKVLKCDVLESAPLSPVVLPQADCLLSILCLESACKDLDTCRRALNNISTLLKVGGHLVIGGVLGCGSWMSGEKEFPGLPFTENFFRSALVESGFVFRELDVQPVTDTNKHICNYYGDFFILAQKQKEMSDASTQS